MPNRKPLTEEQRASRREYNRQWRLANLDRARENSRRWNQANPDVIKACRARYQEKHPDRVAATKERYENTPQRIARKKAWWYANRDRILGARRKGTEEGYRAAEEIRTALLGNDVYAAADRAVPRGLPADIRDDVISAIVLAVLEEEITVEEVATRGKAYLTAHYRDFTKFGRVSLDQNIPGHERLTYGETIASDVFHF